MVNRINDLKRTNESNKARISLLETENIRLYEQNLRMRLKRIQFTRDLHFLVMTALLLIMGFYLVSVWFQPENSLYNLIPTILTLIGYMIIDEYGNNKV